MTFIKHIQSEKYKTLLSVIVAASGFLIALVVNSTIERHHEYQVYLSMRQAIKIEAEANGETLESAFLRYYKSGVVLQQFETAVVSQLMYSPIFLKFSQPDEVKILSRYYRSLALANRYREKSEAMILEGKASEQLPSLMTVWSANLKECEMNISLTKGLP